MNEQRQCFRLATQEQLHRQHWILVHGTIEDDGKNKGVRFPYAWLEDITGNIVWNVETKTLMVREMFYDLGKVKDTIRYGFSEMVIEMRHSEHYGPWYPELMKYYERG